ncbi:NADH-cytochrome b5 reductase 3-like isoform X2 [Dinothrombium tinctorium]|uniref:NADH-cytochrome b5 reductase n=1 Tax=Dinothrombium tinctorium TaxID=1965070 RepID=A0A3S3NGR8_9ACAR|nr:NADH-cytochrome b5 reductase 3-like isoform X2 [Dinothrombium tinctorium]
MKAKGEYLVFGTLVVTSLGAAYLFYSLFLRKKKAKILLKEVDKKYEVTLIEKEVITRNTRRFRFALPSNEYELGLNLGQHIYLSTYIDDKLVVRSYTPVSGQHVKGFFDLVVKIYFKNENPKYPEGGKMSQHLDSMKIGDKINIRGPDGNLIYKGKGKFAIRKNKTSPFIFYEYKKCGMIAGGSGLTPMLQLLRAALEDSEDETQFWLLFANQSEEDILLRSELELLAKRHPSKFHLWFTVSKANNNWKYSLGHIDADMIKNSMPPPDDKTLILLCGPPPMINLACKPNLDALGYKSQHRHIF